MNELSDPIKILILLAAIIILAHFVKNCHRMFCGKHVSIDEGLNKYHEPEPTPVAVTPIEEPTPVPIPEPMDAHTSSSHAPI